MAPHKGERVSISANEEVTTLSVSLNNVSPNLAVNDEEGNLFTIIPKESIALR